MSAQVLGGVASFSLGAAAVGAFSVLDRTMTRRLSRSLDLQVRARFETVAGSDTKGDCRRLKWSVLPRESRRRQAFLRAPATTWFPLRLCLCGALPL